ncbi:YhgE/Pip domain-containing protein [uncultured Bifidobacterium sp.]|uniref:YhgE/Pip domain-containing protein n=2 Tax=uncultured Bifidobacterium sp. TaxID=165187 RepID=UPI0027DD55D1|nr:YhgE/Pip domain-containing protein [uncultured Bifidobacterium sp.]
MRNVLSVFVRDVRRLLRVPAAWVIVLGLAVLPAFYAWVNIIGFWNPYGNTANVRVSVVNRDRGTESAPIAGVDLGDRIVDSLGDNHDIGWAFVDEDTAMRDVRSGRSYAAIVIPEDFSDRLAGLIAGDDKRPALEYYVNEKASPIAPKVTDTAANTVDRQVNATFVSTVSEVVAQAVNQAEAQASDSADAARAKADRALADAQDAVASIRSAIADVTDADDPMDLTGVRATLDDVRRLGADAASGLDGLSDLLGTTRTTLGQTVYTASTAFDTGNSLLSQANAKATGALASASGAITAANGQVSGGLATLQDITDRNATLLNDLKALSEALPDSAGTIAQAIEQLQQANTTLDGTVESLTALNGTIATTATDTGALADDLGTATQQALDASAQARSTLNADAWPALGNGLGALSTASGTLGGQLSAQGTLIDQASLIVDQLDQALQQTKTALSDTDAALARVQTRLGTLRTDLGALSSAGTLDALFGGDGTLDERRIADFMLSPTVLDEHVVYPVNSYGSGMAPLFTNLAMWAGVFMLVALMKLETDGEGVEDLTATQAYLGRWLLLAVMAAAQGLVVTVGDLVIGVQTVSPVAFVATGVIASVTYSAVAYMLATTLLHVGKALIMVMIIVQIPGAGGMYPIEMMPGFFRALHPFFPFTYAIDALRETIGGFYGNVWWTSMAHLLVFAAVAFAVGIGVRPRLTNVNRLFARQIAQAGILNGEPVTLRGHEYPIGQILRVLGDRTEYREAIVQRAAAFEDLYPRLRRGATIAGFVVPIILAVTFSLTTDAKLAMLGAWTVWVLLIIAFLMGIELMRDHLRRQVELGNLDDEEIRVQLALRDLDRTRARRARRRRRARRADRTREAARRIVETDLIGLHDSKGRHRA